MMTWQQKHRALETSFGAISLSVYKGRFTAELANGWVFSPAGLERETATAKTAPGAIGKLFSRMAHPVKGEKAGRMDGGFRPTKWSAAKRNFVPDYD
jgi:hypothetical protein